MRVVPFSTMSESSAELPSHTLDAATMDIIRAVCKSASSQKPTTADEPNCAHLSLPLEADLAEKFGRKDRRYIFRDVTVLVHKQKCLPSQVYAIVSALSQDDLPLNVHEFVRVWRTFVYKRTQDVYLWEKGLQMEDTISLPAEITVPAPLGDLLQSLGAYESVHMGLQVHIVPPKIDPIRTPNWCRLSQPLLTKWCAMMELIEPIYTLRPYPSRRQWKGTAISLTARVRNEKSDSVSLYALTTEPTASDSYLRLISDDLFNPVTFDCGKVGFRVIEDVSHAELLADYCVSYVKCSAPV